MVELGWVSVDYHLLQQCVVAPAQPTSRSHRHSRWLQEWNPDEESTQWFQCCWKSRSSHWFQACYTCHPQEPPPRCWEPWAGRWRTSRRCAIRSCWQLWDRSPRSTTPHNSSSPRGLIQTMQNWSWNPCLAPIHTPFAWPTPVPHPHLML